MYQAIFNRVEKKYLLTEEDYILLMGKLDGKIKKDENHFSTICNLYLDTKNYDLIRKSIEKPIYKETFRIRSYNIPNLQDTVFFEIKKKYKDIVSKRRVKMKLEDVYKYLETRNYEGNDIQIMKEIDYNMKRYELIPSSYIAYERYSYLDNENIGLRITFDTNLRYRDNELRLELGSSGKLVFNKTMYIMEVKTLGGLPLWFSSILSELKIYPKSFSKYGNVYKKYLFKKERKEYV